MARSAPPFRWSLAVGSLFGIPIRVHATFALLVVWFAQVTASQGGSALAGVSLILLLLGSVALHELGHALMARRFGVDTREIVLHPVGGFARLAGVPTGVAELLIALAGPAVNLALVALLTVVAVAFGLPASPPTMAAPTPATIVSWLLFANLFLALLNLLPAFPLDGGKVLRAILSLGMPVARATRVAAAVGQAMALLLAAAGVATSSPLLLLVALVIFLGAAQEAAALQRRRWLAGRTVADAAVTRLERLAPQDPLGRAAQLMLRTPQSAFPVVDAWGRPAGVLTRQGLLDGLARLGPEGAVLEVAQRQASTAAPDDPLDGVLPALEQGSPVLVVVDGELRGMVTPESVGHLLELLPRLAPHGGGRG